MTPFFARRQKEIPTWSPTERMYIIVEQVCGDMPDYEKFATKAMDTAHNRGIDVADPDAVEPIAKEVAREYVVDEEKLVAIVRQRAKEYTDAGNIYENPPEKSDDYPEADVVAESLLEKASEYDVPDEEVEDIDWSQYNTDEYLEDGEMPVPERFKKDSQNEADN